MSNIKISDLHTVGADLFSDSESYLQDLTEQEMGNTLGGGRVWILWTGLCVEW
ncbi:hypothetical protein [Crocosphaera sp. XPORK-15E]|uniref:hypothetical protein n=1 Tax=Crocosphaera sp. XPORK-15E TaxID=3110247 RepID=UPI002B1EAE56|nr:hypothetical protein [Crocosphaera sp. XPORK-15E]MEA5535806.1 hypothetical protein [Crocosphaera sp. XPORK-15E]